MVGIVAIPQFHSLPERAYCSGLPVGEVAKWAVRRDVEDIGEKDFIQLENVVESLDDQRRVGRWRRRRMQVS